MAATNSKSDEAKTCFTTSLPVQPVAPAMQTLIFMCSPALLAKVSGTIARNGSIVGCFFQLHLDARLAQLQHVEQGAEVRQALLFRHLAEPHWQRQLEVVDQERENLGHDAVRRDV